MYTQKTTYVPGCLGVLVVLIIVGGIALLVSLPGGNQAATQQAQIQANAEVRKEYAKAEQIEETYSGLTDLVDAEGDAYVKRRLADLLYFESAQKWLLIHDQSYYIQHGLSRQDAEDRGWNLFSGLIAGVVLASAAIAGLLYCGPGLWHWALAHAPDFPQAEQVSRQGAALESFDQRPARKRDNLDIE